MKSPDAHKRKLPGLALAFHPPGIQHFAHPRETSVGIVVDDHIIMFGPVFRLKTTSAKRRLARGGAAIMATQMDGGGIDGGRGLIGEDEGGFGYVEIVRHPPELHRFW